MHFQFRDFVRNTAFHSIGKTPPQERETMTSSIAESNRLNEGIKKKLQQPPFNLSYVSRTDIIRYKLYCELEKRGYRTLYSNTYILPFQYNHHKIFGKKLI